MYTILHSRFYADPEVNKCFGCENKFFDLKETYEEALKEVKRQGKTPYTMKDNCFVFVDDRDLQGPIDEYQIIEEEIDLPF